jgi:HD superfamily phosphohydrolase
MWYPNQPDAHAALGTRIIQEDPVIQRLMHAFDPGILEQVVEILEERSTPSWTWQLISSGGWNADRGDWTYRDSLHCGVSLGQYDVEAMLSGLAIDEQGELVMEERGLAALEHYIHSRAALYRIVFYQKSVLAAESMHVRLAQRARALHEDNRLGQISPITEEVLSSGSPESLPLATINRMRESWFKEQLLDWRLHPDPILRQLAERISRRDLLKSVNVTEQNVEEVLTRAQEIAQEEGYPHPKYFVFEERRGDKRASDLRQGLKVRKEDGSSIPLTEALAHLDPDQMKHSGNTVHRVYAPAEVVQRLRD